MRDEVGNTALNAVRPSHSHRPKLEVEKQNKLQNCERKPQFHKPQLGQIRNRGRKRGGKSAASNRESVSKDLVEIYASSWEYICNKKF